jgi:hypothetical protein
MDAVEIDRELDELQGKIEQLRALYEQYFMGFERMEPLAQRKDVERRVKILRREQLRNTAQRFKLNTLVQRINTMQQHWVRVVREIENGTYRRDVIRAAARFGEGALAILGQKKPRDVAAAIAKAEARRSLEDTVELAADDLIDDDAPTPPMLETPRPQAPPLTRGETRPVLSGGLGQGDLPVVGAIGSRPWPVAPPVPSRGAVPPPVQRAAAFGELDLDLSEEPFPRGALADQRIRQIYAQYVETKRSTQESIAGVTFERVAASLRAQADRLKSVHPNKSVDYEVVVKDGKTHLRPVLR